MTWKELATHHWDRAPAVIRCAPGASPAAAGPPGSAALPETEPPATEAGPAPLPSDAVFGLAVRAAAPFRLGTRTGAVPDVRFFTAGGWSRAPGERLPGAEDRIGASGAGPTGAAERRASAEERPAAARYAERLDQRADTAAGWLCEVEQPLSLDFALWRRVRDQLAGLWQETGWPALPLACEIDIGHRHLRTRGAARPPGSAVLVWVVSGSLEVDFWRENGTTPQRASPDLRLRGRSGELLYWPAGYRYTESFDGPCLVLRVAVPATPRAAEAALKNLLMDRAGHHPRYADGRAPFLPYPPPAASDGRVPAIERVRATGELLREVTHGPELSRALRTQWAVRRSAAGLEPVPAPAAEASLGPDDVIEATGEILRSEDGERTLWAVNGHLLPVAGGAADRIRRELRPGRRLTPAQLCAAVRAPEEHHAPVLALLRTLLRLRAVEHRPGAAPPDTGRQAAAPPGPAADPPSTADAPGTAGPPTTADPSGAADHPEGAAR